MNETTLIYRDAQGREIHVVCPWGDHSGNVPPPHIQFSTGTFVYQGAAPLTGKSDYVRGQGQTRRHGYHWPGCETQVPPAMWGCKKHWFQLPKRLRDQIWLTYVPGQEIDMTPSPEYIAVAQAVQDWIKREGNDGG